MNHTYRLVYNAALNMFVVASELARNRGKGGSGAGSQSPAARLRVPQVPRLSGNSNCRLGRLPCYSRMGLCTASNCRLARFSTLTAERPATPAQSPTPSAINSVSFTAGQTGSNYLLFAFRQDPASGPSATSRSSKPGPRPIADQPEFTQGGSVSNSGIQAPANWGIVYQTGSPPEAAGTWSAPGCQRVDIDLAWESTRAPAVPGRRRSRQLRWHLPGRVPDRRRVVHRVLFGAFNNDANTSSVRMGVFAGPCLSLMTAAAECRLDSSTGFTTLYQPSETNNAGAPAITVIASPTNAADLTATNIFDGGTLVADGTTLDGRNYSITGNNGVIDTHGYNTVISTPITDDSAGTPGGLGVTNTTGSGRLTLSGVNTYTGGTTVSQGANLTLTGDGSIAASGGLTNNGHVQYRGHQSGRCSDIPFRQWQCGAGGAGPDADKRHRHLCREHCRHWRLECQRRP